jgi:hypothetical protein
MNMACVRPNSEALDNGPLTGAGPGYATRHNPFIYFHSLLDLGGCAENDVSLNQLPKDLHSATKTARLTFISPQACRDSSARSCPNSAPSGLAGEDAFLKKWVPGDHPLAELQTRWSSDPHLCSVPGRNPARHHAQAGYTGANRHARPLAIRRSGKDDLDHI